MSRSYILAGETLVLVQGRTGSSIDVVAQLGLSEDPITIEPSYYHHDMTTDDFGSEIPADVFTEGGDVRIRMTLVHYDDQILDTCIKESMAASQLGTTGSLAAAGTLMGGAQGRWTGSNHYITLYLNSARGLNWRFKTAYLANQPITYPLGTKRSIVQCTWRAIPYLPADEVDSGAIALWDYIDFENDNDA